MRAIVLVNTVLSVFLLTTLQSNAQFQFTDIKPTEEGAILLAWQSDANTLYRLECSTNLDDPAVWRTLADLYPSHGTNTFILDTGDYYHTPFILHPRKDLARFYRVINLGTNTGPAPSVSISSPGSGSAAFGTLNIAVSASTDQATLSTKLYVDGQEMPPPSGRTNYISGETNFMTDNYSINTCEWPNGPHTLFAMAECYSDAISSPGTVAGRAVSSYVPVTFSNLITRFAWSEPFFTPSIGQTQQVTAIFSANVDWTLQVLNRSSNAVRTVAGSGNSMLFDFDGTGDGGTNLPAGVYRYLLSVQTNGQASSMAFAGQNDESLASFVASQSAADENWRPTSAPQARAAGLSSFLMYPPPYPPILTNGTLVPWEDIFGPQEPIEIFLPEGRSAALPLSGPSILAGAGYGGPSSQSTVGPTRPPIAPALNITGTYAIAYQKYHDPSGNLVPPTLSPPTDDKPGFPANHPVEIMGSRGPISILPIPKTGAEGANFEYYMYNGSWAPKYAKRDAQVQLMDLVGTGSPLNDANIALIFLHSVYGTSEDWHASLCQQIYFPLWTRSINADGTFNTQSAWIRMSDMKWGGTSDAGLRWIALESCFSLRQENVDSMSSVNIKPFNNNLHFMLGAHTFTFDNQLCGGVWANRMINSNTPIWQAWLQAGANSFLAFKTNITVEFALWGHTLNLNDHIDEYFIAPSGSIGYEKEKVFPLP